MTKLDMRDIHRAMVIGLGAIVASGSLSAQILTGACLNSAVGLHAALRDELLAERRYVRCMAAGDRAAGVNLIHVVADTAPLKP